MAVPSGDVSWYWVICLPYIAADAPQFDIESEQERIQSWNVGGHSPELDFGGP